jgi:hypothetical protein
VRSIGLLAAAVVVACGGVAAATADYVYSDAFERRSCDGVGCSFCSPADPLPLCGTHSHCVPQSEAGSMCTYPDGAGKQGAACSADDECSGAFACVPTQTVPQCLHWCRRPAGTECQAVAGTTCVGFVVPVLIGTQEWGVCR